MRSTAIWIPRFALAAKGFIIWYRRHCLAFAQVATAAFTLSMENMTMTLGHVTRNVGVLVAIVIVAYAGLCLLLFASQRSMIYQPQRSAVKDRHESGTAPFSRASLR